MHLQQLLYVLKVYELCNFSRAAEELFITQPTLSQQIQSLETELQLKLFVRQPRHVSLTDAGEAFIPYAMRIINELDGMKRTMDSFATQAKGSVRIGALWIFGYLGISDNIALFREKHPEVDVTITVNGSRKLLDMLLSRKVDAVYLITSDKQVQRLELDAYEIQQSEVYALVPKKHPLSNCKNIRFEQLEGENLIIPDADSNLRISIMSHLGAHGIIPKIVCESSQPDVIVTSVANDIGISFLSHNVAESFQDVRVAFIPIIPAIYRSIYFVTLKAMRDNSTIYKLTEHVISSYNANLIAPL